MIKFEWDEQKNRGNRKKHGIWFEEAAQVFDDSSAIMFFDEGHSKHEDRFIFGAKRVHPDFGGGLLRAGQGKYDMDFRQEGDEEGDKKI